MIEFVDTLPPIERAGGRGQRGPQAPTRAILDELHARPGEWALVSTHPTSRTASGRAVTLRRYPGVEVKQRLIEGEHRVYARFAG